VTQCLENHGKKIKIILKEKIIISLIKIFVLVIFFLFIKSIVIGNIKMIRLVGLIKIRKLVIIPEINELMLNLLLS
jgi:hypothetical protein